MAYEIFKGRHKPVSSAAWLKQYCGASRTFTSAISTVKRHAAKTTAPVCAYRILKSGKSKKKAVYCCRKVGVGRRAKVVCNVSVSRVRRKRTRR